MNARITTIASALVIALGGVSVSGLAHAETFNAWGHEFNVPGSSSGAVAVMTASTYTAMHTDTDLGPEQISGQRTGAKHAHAVARGTVRH